MLVNAVREVLTFDLPKKRSLSDLVFEEIERLILDGVLKPGEPVNEKAFSDHNGLSRAPIREACRKLNRRACSNRRKPGRIREAHLAAHGR